MINTQELSGKPGQAPIYVVNEEVVGDELNTPMRELLSSQRGWSVFEESGDGVLARELIAAEAKRREGPRGVRNELVTGLV